MDGRSIVMSLERMCYKNLGQIGKCLIDKDKRDKKSEDLLCESGYKADQEAAVEGYH